MLKLLGLAFIVALLIAADVYACNHPQDYPRPAPTVSQKSSK